MPAYDVFGIHHGGGGDGVEAGLSSRLEPHEVFQLSGGEGAL
jgi:hypothetical protein